MASTICETDNCLRAICCFWQRCGAFLNGRSALLRHILSREMKDRNKFTHISKLYGYSWCLQDFDEDVLMIKVQTERYKVPGKEVEFSHGIWFNRKTKFVTVRQRNFTFSVRPYCPHWFVIKTELYKNVFQTGRIWKLRLFVFVWTENILSVFRVKALVSYSPRRSVNGTSYDFF